MKKKILISTGGSGGHVIPAITFHDHLKEKFDVFLTTDKRTFIAHPYWVMTRALRRQLASSGCITLLRSRAADRRRNGVEEKAPSFQKEEDS